MEFFKKNKLFIAGFIIILGIMAFWQWQIVKTKEQLSELYRDLDSKLENVEINLLKLKEEGYVEADEFSDISQRISKSTVLITGTDDISEINKANSEKELASGFFVREDGYIVTAKHAVDAIGRDNIFVFTFSGKQYKARVIDLDDISDVALIKVDAGGFPAVPFGYFDNLQVGDEIGFVGFSLNTSISKPLVYRGVVSAKGTDDKGAKVFSINAFVNKGNSGGPVFSAETGRVVGMVSARQRDVSSNRYISLPSNYQSAFMLGGVDPLKLSVELYNKTVELVSDVSQVGVGIVFSLDRVGVLIGVK